MSPKISRRELLKNGAKAAAMLSVSAVVSVEAEAQRRPETRRRGAAVTPKGGALARLDEFVERHMGEMGAPGMTLALADRAGVVRVSTYGFADTKARARVRPETLFEIGSVSKSFAAVALLQMHDEGRVDLHRPVAEYLPWLKLEQRHGAVTAHHLLSHTSGLQGAPLLPESVAATLETFYKPGEKFVYSNIGYLILGLFDRNSRPPPFRRRTRGARPRAVGDERELARHHQRPAAADGRRLRARVRRPPVPRARGARRGRVDRG